MSRILIFYGRECRKFRGVLQAVWDFTANYAWRLIAPCEIVENIKTVPIGTIPSTRTLVTIPVRANV